MSKTRRILKWLFYGFIGLILIGLGGGAYGYHKLQGYKKNLPSLWPVLDYRPALSTRVYDHHHQLIGEFFAEKRIYAKIDQIPEKLQLAFVSAEDKNFFKHHGIDFVAIARAGMANARAGHVVQGGSTITQQVAKMLLVGKERKLDRKIREALLAREIEDHLSKKQILEIYLNQVYLGHGAYGVAAAAEVYFEKTLDRLTLGEMTMLASLTKAPARDSPYHNLTRAKARQEYVIGRMTEAGYLSETEGLTARFSKLNISDEPVNINLRYAPHFVEFVRRNLKEKYDDEVLYKGGLEIHTTLDLKIQAIAEEKIKQAVTRLNSEYQFAGPIGETNLHDLMNCVAAPPPAPGKKRPKRHPILPGERYNGLVMSLTPQVSVCVKHQLFDLDEAQSMLIQNWRGDKQRRVERGDKLSVDFVADTSSALETSKKLAVHLSKVAPIEAAAMVIEPKTGEIRAMVGGSDFAKSEWNRVVQAHRQAGSSIKPFIYSAALEHGFNEMTLVPDAPIAVKTIAGLWQPKNYKHEYLGPITLRTAISKSINTVSVRLVQAIGLDDTISMMKRMGLHSEIPYHISISLGTPDVTLFDMSYAYSIFPNGGHRSDPLYIEYIRDSRGIIADEHFGGWPAKKILDEDTAYVMVDLMKAVVQQGTGRKAKDFPFTDEEVKKMSKDERAEKLKNHRIVAGKTGTSTDFRDAWFIGYTTDLLCGIWVGRDDFTPIGFDATGGKVSLPIWMDIMKEAHPNTPPGDWSVPDSVEMKYIDLNTRHELSPNVPGGTMIPFRKVKEEENLK